MVTDNAGNVSVLATAEATVAAPADTTKPVVENAKLVVDNGLTLNFSINEALDLAIAGQANVQISYFTKDAKGDLKAIQNTKTSAALVKDKTWDGFLWGVETLKNYPKGTANTAAYENELAANTKLATLVQKGYHDNGDMDYVEIDWTTPATYVAQIVVTDNAGNESVLATAEATVAGSADTTVPVVENAELFVDNGLTLNFSINEALDLAIAGQANVQISYFTKDANGSLTAIRNTKTSADLVKDKTWDGFLWGVETLKNYPKGTANTAAYENELAANTELATLVQKGYHDNGDMDYVEINWTTPATYVAQIVVTDNAGNESVLATAEATVAGPADTTKPVVENAKLVVDNGLTLNFSINEALDLAIEGQANVKISYFTKDANGSLTAIRNTKTSADLVKDKTWDGFLWGVETSKNYPKGTANTAAYENELAANTKLATLVQKGYHDNGDMDYVEIDWTTPATYVAQIVVTDNAGNASVVKEVVVTVAP